MEVRVKKTRIIGTTVDVYTAWTPSVLMGPHNSISKFEDSGWWGQLGTERDLPPELEVLTPGSEQRIFSVRTWQKSNELRAHAYIMAAFPDTLYGVRRGGSIDVDES